MAGRVSRSYSVLSRLGSTKYTSSRFSHFKLKPSLYHIPFTTPVPFFFMTSFSTVTHIPTDTDNAPSPRLEFVSGACMIPHPEKMKKGGEDAYFVSPKCLAVADGVGGWITVGVDAGIYSKTLMKNCHSYVESLTTLDDVDPATIIDYGMTKCKHLRGSTTAVILLMKYEDNKNVADICNVGDSRAMILRPDEKTGKYVVKLKTREQQHSFNFPFQLGEGSDDTPSKGDRYSHTLKENDIVVLGTDGIFDNLFSTDIVALINENVDNIRRNEMKLVAEAICKKAFSLSLDTDYISPFAKSAKDHRKYYVGGKSDDITTVVSVVRNPDESGKDFQSASKL